MSAHYLLSAEASRLATEKGWANPKWFRPAVDPQKIRDLMQKSDARAMRDTALWLGAMCVAAGCAIALWPSWWSLPFWLIYGVLYGSGADSRWHECGHNTAFKTAWMNNAVYQIASFMMMRNPAVWRASHVRHHTDTIVVGRDPEIVAMRPPDLLRIALMFVGVVDVYNAFKRMFSHARGRIDPEEAMFVALKDHPKVFMVTRIWLTIYAFTIVLSILTASILPLMLVGLPRLYGAWHHVMTGLLQHLGLAENVSDHRLNTRTVLMNPISRFIYLNMNYHLEHHMFTKVPYYNLPKLHELIKHELPPPERSIFGAYLRLVPVLVKQLQYKEAVIVQDLPFGATPYRREVEILKTYAV
ncbi:hydrocarbon oxygenase [Parasedimentitalea marina]|uniref:Hydrocarbon oxygenase n=2 Tax=Parasedimentitalea marina TaxID=2483033 RepID=A0A3T0N923_9RHOB|nr:hydrocarbon oxygenase [Parasedimentitalea marina]